MNQTQEKELDKVILIYGDPNGETDYDAKDYDIVYEAAYQSGYAYGGNGGSEFLRMYDADYFLFVK